MKIRESAIATAKQIFETRYKDATVAFCTGSYIRGEATEYSDIDLVVLFPKLDFAWRESFVFDGWPVEAFIHDPDTLRYFFYEMDIPSGVPSLPNMVAEGIQVPSACSEGTAFKALASELLNKGPAPLSEETDRNIRYVITDLVDDLRHPRSKAEAIATGVRLYGILADYYFRSHKVWSASGKSIPRRLQAFNKEMAQAFENSFEALFSNGASDKVISFAQELVAPFGGFNFDGYKREAPKEWKKGNPPPYQEVLISGEKVILRDMKESDLDSYWHWFQPGHKWQDFDGPYYQDKEGELLERFQNRKRKVQSKDFTTPRTWLAIADRNTDELIGVVSSYWRSKETYWLCAGITVLNENNWGKGIGSEALTLWTDYLFTNRPEICRLGLETWSGNDGLIHLALKLGYHEEARFLKARIVKGKYFDSLAFGILREKWELR